MKFGDYKKNGHKWITLASGEYFPDILVEACELYGPIIEYFGKLLMSEKDSESLFKMICGEKDSWIRVQLARIFKKYISPTTPVEMLKKKTNAEKICEEFGYTFRDITKAQELYKKRPQRDEALCAILWEYKSRGSKGYTLTDTFFNNFAEQFPNLTITGPTGAGKDIKLGDVFPDYPKKDRPVDFIIWKKDTPLAIGFARYDSDRGGAQEDDRPGGYRNCANEILTYSEEKGLKLKVIFVNDGPGLLLGSMWSDYAAIEESWPGKIMVITLCMMKERLTQKWLES